MTHHQQRQNVHKPSDLEVHNDAAKILEEILEKHLEKNLKVPRKVRRNKTDPNSETIITNLSGSENALMRIQIKTYRHSKSLDEKLSQNQVIYLKDKASQRNVRNKQHSGSDSSIDTDDEQVHGPRKHRKKSLLKRAKERFLQTFRRDQKEPSAKTTNRKRADSTPSIKHSLKNQQGGKSTHEAHSQEKAFVEKDKNPEERSNGSNGHSVEHSSRKELLIGPFLRIEKSGRTRGLSDNQPHTFDSRRDSPRRLQYRDDIGASVRNYSSGEGQLSTGQTSDTSSNLYPEQSVAFPKGLFENMPSKPEHSSTLPPSTQSVSYDQEYSKDKSRDLQNLYPSSVPIIISDVRGAVLSRDRSPSPSSQRLNVATEEPGSITRATSGSSSGLLQPEGISNGPAVRVLYRAHSNVLDSPGEDIEFMDIDNSVLTVRKSSSGVVDLVGAVHITDAHFPDGEESLRRPHRLPGVHSGDPNIVQSAILAQGEYESAGPTLSVPAVHPAIVSDSPQESLLEDQGGPPAQTVQTSTDREDLYEKIALKLIAMGDLYSASASDQETGGAAAAQPLPLTELENEIITCLRAGGDRYSRQLDESFEEATQQTVQEAYARFNSTVTNSMGSELSWNHVAFLFYTTKGVVSAVGQGSRTATRVKEFTLQYITDTFASWIINQGGFDSVLSSEESDFDVD